MKINNCFEYVYSFFDKPISKEEADEIEAETRRKAITIREGGRTKKYASSSVEKQGVENLYLDSQPSETLTSENHGQYNTKETIQKNSLLSNKSSIIPSVPTSGTFNKNAVESSERRMTDRYNQEEIDEYTEVVRENIGYLDLGEWLCADGRDGFKEADEIVGCAVLQFYDNGRLVMTQEAQPGDKFEKYINILKHPTTDGQPSFIGWYTAEYGGEKYTDDMVINDFSVISLYARYDNYVEPIEPPTEPSTEPNNPYVPDEPDVPVGETKTLMFLKNTEAQISLNVRSVDAEVGKYIYDYLPIIPQEYANVFDGWYTSKTGGRKIIETDKVENGSYTTMFIYAHWKNEDGDANYDGKVTVADAVMLQKWLLGSGELTCWQNVDLCKDERIDVFDLCLLKRMIIEN